MAFTPIVMQSGGLNWYRQDTPFNGFYSLLGVGGFLKLELRKEKGEFRLYVNGDSTDVRAESLIDAAIDAKNEVKRILKNTLTELEEGQNYV